MLWVCLATAVSLAFAADAPPKTQALADFVDQVVSDGIEYRFPSPIAALIGVPSEIPSLNYDVKQEQTTDGMSHGFNVLARPDPASGEAKPVGLVFDLEQKVRGGHELYYFRASLTGKLEKVAVINGKDDAQGHAIKGAGSSSERDIRSSEIKKKFQHELDLWLKRAYLKKEWRSAEFSNGVLKK